MVVKVVVTGISVLFLLIPLTDLVASKETIHNTAIEELLHFNHPTKRCKIDPLFILGFIIGAITIGIVAFILGYYLHIPPPIDW